MKKIILTVAFLIGIGVSESFAQAVNCPDCKGKGYTALNCNACQGRGGNERYTYRDCRACKGSGKIREKVGYVDGREAYREIDCPYCNGSKGKEKAGSEWIRCSKCNGSGESRTKCGRCGGTGTVRVKRN